MTTGKSKEKPVKIPKFIIEITVAIVVYLVLCLLCYFLVGEYIKLADQSLSTIGIALSTSLGVLTAIVVSFALIIWQTSRRDRIESYLRWRNALHQLFEFYDVNMEKYPEIGKDIYNFTQEASAIASIEPMKRQRYKELVSPISDKLENYAKNLLNVHNVSAEQSEKVRIGKYILDYLVMLTHANFHHNVAHNLYPGLLGLRGLLYRLLCVLVASIILVAIAGTATTLHISDIFNAPLAIVLILCIIYLFIQLGIMIKKFTRLEDEFLRLEREAKL